MRRASEATVLQTRQPPLDWWTVLVITRGGVGFGVFGFGSALELGAWSLGFDTPRITRPVHEPQSRSIASATPFPPPRHRAAMPRRTFLRRIAWINVVS